MRNVIIIFLLTFSFYSCSINNWDVKRYRSKFERNRVELDTLVELLKNEKLKVGYSINENDLPKNIRAILEELDISNIDLKTTDCVGITEYQLTAFWSNKATVYFSKDTCDNQSTHKGYHAKTSEMVEVWGLGDDWLMMIDHDFI